MGKYRENWKYGKFEKCNIGNMKNLEYVKNNRNEGKYCGRGEANTTTLHTLLVEIWKASQ